MFTLSNDHTYDWPVTIQVPTDGGSHKPQQFTARFRVLDQERMDALIGGADLQAGANIDIGLLRECLIGWEQVAAEDGTEIPFTDTNRDRLLGVPYVRLAVILAYMESVSKTTGARRKN